MDPGRGELLQFSGFSLGLLGAVVDHRGPLNIGPVIAGGAGDHGVLAGLGQDHELVGEGAPDGARVGLYGLVLEPQPVVDAAIGVVHEAVALGRGLVVHIKGVGVLHAELAAPHDPEPGPDLVPHLLLEMVEIDGQFAIGADLLAADVGDDLLVGGGQAVVAAVAVLEAEELLAVILPTAGFLPQLGRLDLGHEHLYGPGPVHLLPDYLLHLLKGGETVRQKGINPGGQLADHGRSEHEDVGGHLGLGRDLPQGGQEILG